MEEESRFLMHRPVGREGGGGGFEGVGLQKILYVPPSYAF